jgi:GMP reductase
MNVIDNGIKLDFNDVLIVPSMSELTSRQEVNLVGTYTFGNTGISISATPVMNSNMDHTGTFEMSKALAKSDMISVLHKHYSADELIQFFKWTQNKVVFYSMGIVEQDVEKFEQVYAALLDIAPIQFVCIDVANGYMTKFIQFVRDFRAKYPNICIMAGNVVTPEGVSQLACAGANIVKVGIGSGSVCTTRKVAGVGYPQLSAIMECSTTADSIGVYLCSDGGIINTCDTAKALAAGADFVMIGGMFAGHFECGGELIDTFIDPHYERELVNARQIAKRASITDVIINELDGSRYVIRFDRDFNLITPAQPPSRWFKITSKSKMAFRGMSSADALRDHHGGKAPYRAAEGKTVHVPLKGELSETIETLLGGLRSTCTYVGANNITQLYAHSRFIQVNNQLNESLSGYNV